MIRIFRQIFRTGIVTEPLKDLQDDSLVQQCSEIEAEVKRALHGSLTLRQVDAGSCNGCELEIHALNNPFYNCERYGLHFTASPRFADMLLVTGPVSRNMEVALKRTYDATPAPKIVLAVGDCACTGGVFGESYASLGSIDKAIPVDIRVAGCPPTPESILHGILAALKSQK